MNDKPDQYRINRFGMNGKWPQRLSTAMIGVVQIWAPSVWPRCALCFILLIAAALPGLEGVGMAPALAMGLRDQELSPLSGEPGDIERGRSLVLQQEKSSCILCHALPEPSVRFTGDLGPPLHGVGARLSTAQLRYRLIDASRLNPETVMPAYFRTENLQRVSPSLQGKPVLTAQEIEDVVAYLSSLK
jgi:L-cysteine S-thiosulfotransferase